MTYATLERRCGTIRTPMGASATFRTAHRWCSMCGNLWLDWDMRDASGNLSKRSGPPFARCTCPPDMLVEFYDQNAVKAALQLGGNEAVWAMEQAEYNAHRQREMDIMMRDVAKRVEHLLRVHQAGLRKKKR